MRRALLATLLCAAPLVSAPAYASDGLLERQALREALLLQPRAASGVVPLPLPDAARPRATAAATSELTQIARTTGPARVLVGVRRHRDLTGVARALQRLGAAPEAFQPMGVLAATAPSGASLARALAGDSRVAYVERDDELRIAADPLDVLDPATQLKFTWFYDDVRATDALVAAGGGSQRSIAILDTGLDLTHPEFAGSGRIGRTFDTRTKGTAVADAVGHGTFVTGLIAAVDGNGVGGKGVAGNTKVLPIRASRDGGFTERDLLRGIDFAVRRGADVLNLSLAGDGISESVVRALATAFFNDVLPVAASGNTGTVGNVTQYPAAVLGGRRGAPGIGLSVGATRPNGTVAEFSTHNEFVSLAGPGAGPAGCQFGLLSTLPPGQGTEWDRPDSCSLFVPEPSGARFAYGEGTSFAAPVVSGIASLTWQVERRLASEQVAEVLIRSARQTLAPGWNQFSGRGVVDGLAATTLARTYDVTSPRANGNARRSGGSVKVRVASTTDRTEAGRELAGGVTYGLLVSRNGGKAFKVATSRRRRPFRRTMALKGNRANVFAATACDGNGNCGVKRLGRFKR
jgi:subtilisin family serine protease